MRKHFNIQKRVAMYGNFSNGFMLFLFPCLFFVSSWHSNFFFFALVIGSDVVAVVVILIFIIMCNTYNENVFDCWTNSFVYIFSVNILYFYCVSVYQRKRGLTYNLFVFTCIIMCIYEQRSEHNKWQVFYFFFLFSIWNDDFQLMCIYCELISLFVIAFRKDAKNELQTILFTLYMCAIFFYSVHFFQFTVHL